MGKVKNTRKRLLTLVLALAMVITSVSVPTTTAEAAKKVKVKKVQITSPKKKTTTLVKGKTLQIKVKVTPKNASNKKMSYKTSNRKIATVSSKGKVKGIKKGTAKITVTAKDGSKKKTTLTVKVVNPVKVKKVTLSKKSASIYVGKTVTLKATCTPKNATDKSVSWKSSNKKTATVSSKGVVKGIKAGKVTITATAKDGSKKKATCSVTVKANPVTPPAPKVTLEKIDVTKAPMKTNYYVGENFDPAGMEVTASYSNKSTKLLAQTDYTLKPSTTTALRTIDKAVTVSYTEGAITKTATTPISVKVKPTVKSIEVTTQPTKKEYTEGEVFDPAGMVITATLTDGTTKEITDYTYSKEPLAVTVNAKNTMVTISYKVSSSKTLTVDVPVLVKAKDPLKSISAELKKTVLEKEGACFNDDDVAVKATFESGKTADISMDVCTVDPAAFTLSTTSATIKYLYGGVEKSVTVSGFTVTAYRERYTFEDAKSVGTIVKRENESGNAVPTEEYAKDVQPQFVDGVNGKAIKMDGTYGLRLDKIAGTASKNYSISAWFKPEGNLNPNQALIISTANKFGLTDGLPETWCAVAGNDPNGTKPPSDNKLKLWSYDSDMKWSTIGRTENPIPVGADAGWTHVVLVVDNAGEEGDNYATGTLYVNGKAVTSGKVRNEKNELMKTYIGVTGWKDDGYFKGLVDELVFTNEILTAEEVQKYYLEGLGGSGQQVSEITAVTPEENADVNIAFGTSLADVKRELEKVQFKASVNGQEEPVTLTTTANMWTVEGYDATVLKDAKASVTLQAPDGYLFKQGDGLSLTMTRTVTLKVLNPATVDAVTPSQTEITVPYNAPEANIKEQLAALTFAVTTSDGSAYEIANAASLWTLTKTEGGYKAVFDLGTPKVGYTYAQGLKVEVAVKEKQPNVITGLTVTPSTLAAAYALPEEVVKEELAKLAITAQVAGDGEGPAITNAAELWTITGYAATTAGTYTAKAAITAPTGYTFAEGVSNEVSVTVTVKAAGAHVLSNIKVTTNPTRMKYIVDDDFDKAGMAVTAYYEDGTKEAVTENVTVAELKNMVLGKNTVEVSYTEGEGNAAITKKCTLDVTAVKVEDGAASLYTFDDTLENAVDSSKVGKTVKLTAYDKYEDTNITDFYEDDSVKGKSLKVAQNVAVEIPESISEDNKAFTINLWAKKKNGTKNWATILHGKNGAQYGKGLVVYANPDGDASSIQLQTNGGNTPKNFAVGYDVWTMLTFVNEDGSMRFYVNGEEQALSDEDKKALSVTGGIQRMLLGVGQWAAGDYLVGNIDEVSIYSSSLKTSQVGALYKLVKPTISGISVDAKQEDFTFLASTLGGDTTPIQNALKALKINVAMKVGQAPEIANDTEWTLTETETGYKATKKVTIPEGYAVAEGVSDTVEVNVIVKNAVLDSIAITKQPSKLWYVSGEEFDMNGLVVTATYDDESTKDVTKNVTLSDQTIIAPDDVVTAEKEITISYEEGGVTKTAVQKVTVINPSTPEGAMLAARTGYFKFDGNLKNEITGGSAEEAILSKKADGASPSYNDAGMAGKSLVVSGPKGKGVKLDTVIADTANYSISMWVKAVKLGDEDLKDQAHAPVLFMQGAGSYQNTWFSNMAGNSEHFLIRGADWDHRGDHESGNQTEVLVKDTWKMLTLSVEDNNATFYVDGVEKFKMTMYHGTNGTLYLGTCPYDWTFNAEYDEVSIYNRPLSAEQVGILYNSVKPAE